MFFPLLISSDWTRKHISLLIDSLWGINGAFEGINGAFEGINGAFEGIIGSILEHCRMYVCMYVR